MICDIGYTVYIGCCVMTHRWNSFSGDAQWVRRTILAMALVRDIFHNIVCSVCGCGCVGQVVLRSVCVCVHEFVSTCIHSYWYACCTHTCTQNPRTYYIHTTLPQHTQFYAVLCIQVNELVPVYSYYPTWYMAVQRGWTTVTTWCCGCWPCRSSKTRNTMTGNTVTGKNTHENTCSMTGNTMTGKSTHENNHNNHNNTCAVASQNNTTASQNNTTASQNSNRASRRKQEVQAPQLYRTGSTSSRSSTVDITPAMVLDTVGGGAFCCIVVCW